MSDGQRSMRHSRAFLPVFLLSVRQTVMAAVRQAVGPGILKQISQLSEEGDK